MMLFTKLEVRNCIIVRGWPSHCHR